MKFQAAVGSIVYIIKPEELIGDGYLTKPVFEFLEVPEWGVTGRTYAEIYSSGVVHNESRNMAICERARQLANEGRRIYIHTERVVHGKILSNMLKAPFVYSKSKDRDETIDSFKKGYTNILISTLLSEGIDIPEISAIILASGGKSEIALVQRIGRALRPDPKFKNAVICDIVDKGRYLSEHSLARYSCYTSVYGEDIVRNRRK
jgi:superfamily II DNA or RNA helicase